MKTLSIIIPEYDNTTELAQQTLRNIQKIQEVKSNKFKTEIIVIDNGSKCPTAYEGATFIRWPVNKGIAPAWNEGWRHAKGDFLCFMNSDCEVTKGWDFPLVVAAEQMKCIAMPYTNGAKSDGFGITGWCFMVSKETANLIGPFDETFVPAYYEDTDWFHRAINLDISLLNVPSSNVLHSRQQGGTQTLPGYEHVGWLHMSNRYRYAWKHGTDPTESSSFLDSSPRSLIRVTAYVKDF